MPEMDVVGVKVELPLHAPVLLLRERGDGAYLPIWIGAAEASAIVMALDGSEPDRPLTHDLLLDTLTASGASLQRVEIIDVDPDGGVFLAELVVHRPDGAHAEVRVDARPSDAVALAVRADVPIVCVDDVLRTAGVTLGVPVADQEIRKFRSFLEGVTADDFGL